jgi:hypothetical protein
VGVRAGLSLFYQPATTINQHYALLLLSAILLLIIIIIGVSNKPTTTTTTTTTTRVYLRVLLSKLEFNFATTISVTSNPQ